MDANADRDRSWRGRHDPRSRDDLRGDNAGWTATAANLAGNQRSTSQFAFRASAARYRDHDAVTNVRAATYRRLPLLGAVVNECQERDMMRPPDMRAGITTGRCSGAERRPDGYRCDFGGN
jgi:hypothetical protein